MSKLSGPTFHAVALVSETNSKSISIVNTVAHLLHKENVWFPWEYWML